MRLVFGILSLLAVLTVVGLLAKKQLMTVAVLPNPAIANQASAKPDRPAGTKNPQLQSQQIQEQVRLSVEAAIQRPRVVDAE